MKISLSDYLSIIIVLFIPLLSGTGTVFGQSHVLTKGKYLIPVQNPVREERLNEKNLSILSQYIDTSRIRRFNREIFEFESNDSIKRLIKSILGEQGRT